MILGHGDDIHQSNQKIVANFSTNVWYGADISIIQNVIKEHLDKISHYPEPNAGSLVQAIAEKYALTPDNVLAGNGATELFYLIAHAFSTGKTLLPVPSFKEYEDACLLYHHHIIYTPLPAQSTTEDNIIELFATHHPMLCFICNPNNPDGRIWKREVIELLLKTFPKTILVVDESFIDFAPQAITVSDLIPTYKNLLVIQSMTKNFAIPGLRLGYLLGHQQIIACIKKYTYPWSINTLAIEVGKFLLTQGQTLLPNTEEILQRKTTFTAHIQQIAGYTPQPSDTTFFLVHSDNIETPTLKTLLLEKHGILIRDASNFRSLNRHYFRINTLTEEKNNLLIQALESLNSKNMHL